MTNLHRAETNNSHEISAKQIIMSKIDIKAGDLTFGQRIELGQIMSNSVLSDLDKFERTFICLHNYKPKATEYSALINYFGDICNGIAFWTNQEATLLKYEPSAKEKRAGIKDLSLKTGDLGTIKALAKNYSQDPDDVLLWKYGKVFGILYTDLEEYKYQLKYSELK